MSLRASSQIKSNLRHSACTNIARARETVQPLVEALKTYTNEYDEDPNDAVFTVLEDNLKHDSINLHKNIEYLHECYVNQINYVDNLLSKKKMVVEMSTALKVHSNQSSSNVVKINRFQYMNSQGERIASAEEIL